MRGKVAYEYQMRCIGDECDAWVAVDEFRFFRLIRTTFLGKAIIRISEQLRRGEYVYLPDGTQYRVVVKSNGTNFS